MHTFDLTTQTNMLGRRNDLARGELRKVLRASSRGLTLTEIAKRQGLSYYALRKRVQRVYAA